MYFVVKGYARSNSTCVEATLRRERFSFFETRSKNIKGVHATVDGSYPSLASAPACQALIMSKLSPNSAAS